MDIEIKNARVHNLRGIDVTVPRNSLTVVTGLSGSGKSSLAFDTLYAEGQRRYVESLSAYARQFLDRMEKPDVEKIEGLSPAISIEQRTTSGNPRSIVATAESTEAYISLVSSLARKNVPLFLMVSSTRKRPRSVLKVTNASLSERKSLSPRVGRPGREGRQTS